MSRVIVIGAGVAGLATAGLLARDGHEVTVLEKNAVVGGRAGSLHRHGFRFDTGPSWLLLPEAFEHFFALMGTSSDEQLDLRSLDPGYAVFAERHEGAPVSPVAVHARGAAPILFERLEPGAGRRLTAYLSSARRAKDLALAHFLYNPYTRLSGLFRPEVLRVLPRLAGLLSTSLDAFASRRFAHPVLRQILGYPAVFLGTDPRRAPALYHLLSALDLDDGVRYPQGGFARVIDRLTALAEDAGAVIVTDAEVEEILTTTTTTGAEVRGVRWRDGTGVERRLSADIVVSAADLHHTETRLLPPRLRTWPERWWRRRVSGPGAVTVMLGIRGRLPRLPHHSLFLAEDWHANLDAVFGTRPRVPEPASLYACKPSQTDPTVAPEGDENLFLLVPVPPDVALGRGGSEGGGDRRVEEIADAAIDTVSQWAGIPDLRPRILVRETRGPADFAADFHSWRGGMLGPAHVLSQSAVLRARNASRRVRGLYFAGATTSPGVGVPMCLISAELVLKRIRGDRSAGPLPEPAGADVRRRG
ncbi:phytoene desaturase family protein [Microbacterium soli]|uniref:Phytoene desaturase family protein n=1 Tax=Microbacterium soli TaxID=446075 RepID=A0ABP7NG57_9MICO